MACMGTVRGFQVGYEAGKTDKALLMQNLKTLLKGLSLVHLAICTGHTPLVALWLARP